MPIRRSLTASNRSRGYNAAGYASWPWARIAGPADPALPVHPTAGCRAHRRYPFLGLLLLALLLNGCQQAPSLPPLPQLPSLWGEEKPEPARILSLFLPDEGLVTEALSVRTAVWAAANQMQVEIEASPDYSRQLADILAQNQKPDLFVVSSHLFPDLAVAGLLAPAEDHLLDPQDFPQNLSATFTWTASDQSSTRYCLPREVRTLALVYDSEGLAAAGLTPPAHWDTLRAIAEEQSDLSTDRFGLIQSPDLSRWLPFLHGAGGTIMDHDGRLTLQTPAAATALDWYIQIFRDNFAGHARESNSEWSGEALGKGQGALTIEGNWVVPYFKSEFPAFDYGIAPLPFGPAGRNESVAFSSCYAVSASSNLKEEAFALAAFLSAPEVIRDLPNDGGWMPARTALLEEWRRQNPNLAAFADAVPAATVWRFPPGFSPFVRSFNRNMVQLFAAEIEAADLLAELQQQGEATLNAE